MLLKCRRVLAHESWTCELVIKLLWAAVLPSLANFWHLESWIFYSFIQILLDLKFLKCTV